jgi:hypothetical protein
MSSRQLSSNRPFASRARIDEEALDGVMDESSISNSLDPYLTLSPVTCFDKRTLEEKSK